MPRKKSLEDQISKELNKQRSAEEELSLLEKLQEDLKKRKAEARKKLKEEQEQEAFKLGKELFKSYNTTDLAEIKQQIIEESANDHPSISEDDLAYLSNLADRIKRGEHIPYREAFDEIARRF